jgi:tRNA (guanine-N7-)-methyltransferase
MRLRNVKNKDKIIDSSSYFVGNPYNNKGKWHLSFKNNNPIYIEIGMGKGQFIINNALKYPDINFIGIEKYDSVLVRALEESEKYSLSNLKIIGIDAKEIEDVFEKKEVKRIYLNFSDPWPKKKHIKRRLTFKDFLSKYENILDGEIHMKTDNMGLFEYSIESFSEYGYTLKDISLDLTNDDNIQNITTEYEDKFIKIGKKIYRLEAYKK